MKETLYSFLFFLFLSYNSFSQKIPRIENDTLYTKSGFTFYNGQQLQLGKPVGYSPGVMERGYKYIKTFKWDIAKNIKSVTLTKLKKIYTTNLNNTYLEANAIVTFNDNSIFKTTFEINFDGAIASGELIVPDGFRSKITGYNSTSIADEITKLKKLLDDGTITKEEFETAKKKLLQQ